MHRTRGLGVIDMMPGCPASLGKLALLGTRSLVSQLSPIIVFDYNSK